MRETFPLHSLQELRLQHMASWVTVAIVIAFYTVMIRKEQEGVFVSIVLANPLVAHFISIHMLLGELNHRNLSRCIRAWERRGGWILVKSWLSTEKTKWCLFSFQLWSKGEIRYIQQSCSAEAGQRGWSLAEDGQWRPSRGPPALLHFCRLPALWN